MPKKKSRKQNIFLTYFVLFGALFAVSFTILGGSLIMMVNGYSLNEKTNLLKENTATLSRAVSETLIINDMNSSYSPEKEVLSESLMMVSNCIDSAIFI